MEGDGGPKTKLCGADSLPPSISPDQQLTIDYDSCSLCGSRPPMVTSPGIRTLVHSSPIAYGRSDGMPLLRLGYKSL